MRVTATKRGYYGNVVREPGDVFTLADEAMFSPVWMQPVAVHPLDHDGDGRKGGSRPRRAQIRETEVFPPVDPAPAVDAVTGDEI
jgi:hypothetical protein